VAAADESDSCVKLSDDLAVAGCSPAIDSHQNTGRSLARLYARRGGAYQARGDPDHAMLDFNGRWGSIRRIRLRTNRGNAWYRRGDFDRAIADYDEAIQLDPKDAQAYYDRGMAWEKKRRLREALADFKMHSQLAPSGWP